MREPTVPIAVMCAVLASVPAWSEAASAADEKLAAGRYTMVRMYLANAHTSPTFKNRARVLLEEIVTRWPDTEVADKARAKLKELGFKIPKPSPSPAAPRPGTGNPSGVKSGPNPVTPAKPPKRPVARRQTKTPAYVKHLTKIKRAISKEPQYRSTPEYCLLVFGPKAEKHVWAVFDGDTLYLDLNSNGDLTDKGEMFAKPDKRQIRTPKGTVKRKEWGSLSQPVTVIRVGKERYMLYAYHSFLPWREKPTSGFCIRRNYISGLYQASQGTYGVKPSEAPICHFGGLKGPKYFGKQTGALIPGELILVKIALRAPCLGENVVVDTYPAGCPEFVAPEITIELPSKRDAEKPIIIKQRLPYRRRIWFLDNIMIPADAKEGTHARISVTCDAWKDGNVYPSTFEVPILSMKEVLRRTEEGKKREAELVAKRFGQSPENRESGTSLEELIAGNNTGLKAAVARAEQLRRASKTREAIAAIENVYKIATRLYGKSHWRTTYARLAVADFRKRATLTSAQHRELDDVAQLHKKSLQLSKEHKRVEMERIAARIPAILSRILGPLHPDTLTHTNALGMMYLNAGDHAKGLLTLQRSLDGTIKVFGMKHPNTAGRLCDVASAYYLMGDYAKALPLFQQGIDICREVLGPRQMQLADSLNRMAMVHQAMGQYAKALPLFQQSLEINTKAFGPVHRRTGVLHGNLGALYYAMGDYAKALLHQKKGMDISSRVLGPQYRSRHSDLSNLGSTYHMMGDYDKALPVLQESLRLKRTLYGSQHNEVSFALHNLGLLYLATGDYDKALPLLQENLRIKKTTYGLLHRETAHSLESLGVLYRSMGEYDKALPLLKQNMDIARKVLGPQHPRISNGLKNLAMLYHLTGAYDEAEPLAREAVTLSWRNLEAASVVLSERQQLAMSKSLRQRLDAYVALALKSGRYGDSAYTHVLAWKGMVLMRQRAIRALAERPDLAKLFKERQTISSELTRLAHTAPSSYRGSGWQDQMDRLSKRMEHIQAELSAKSVSFRQSQRKVTAAELRRALPKATVLIDVLECRFPLATKGRRQTHLRHLAAFVVHPERPIAVVDLGDFQNLGTAIQRWRRGFGMTEDSCNAGGLLRNQIWDRLEPHITGADVVLVSPDGVLGTLPLSALPGKKPGSYLLEDWSICVMPTPHLLLESARDVTSQRPAAKRLLLVGGVDYTAPPTDIAYTTEISVHPKLAGYFGGGMSFSPLPGTKGEVVGIEKIYRSHHKNEGITTLAGAEATERRFRQEATRHAYLHVATHGFFAPPNIRSALIPRNYAESTPTTGHVSSVHPGLLSGLAMTGANRPDPRGDDGVITAEEVGAMNLSRTNLVVLSACDTGLGQVAGGEGLLGLQRAFQVAGARSVLGSMWKVHDYATMLLMERFYRNMWNENMGKLAALREAQLWMLREGSAHEKMPTEKKPKTAKPTRLPPFFWGAFVLSGDWR